jgi:uncharacterized protein YbjT (DUF2867 family)
VEPDKRIALLAGASGLVGGFLLRRLLSAPGYARVHALSRRPLPLDHPRLANRILPMEELSERLKGVSCDDAFCCLGTTLREAGSIEAQRHVDVGLVLSFAAAAKAAGASRLVVLSSAGADAAARSPYLRMKAEMEAGLRGCGVPAVHILRPGLLLGPRRDSRPAETLARWLMPVAGPFLFGGLADFRGIRAETVADAMLGAARQARKGVFVHSGAGLRTLA